jgi:hypothetical protein
VLVVPRCRLESFADLADGSLALVPFDGAIAPGPAWDAVHATLASMSASRIYVAMNTSGLDAYRPVVAALGAFGLPASRVVCLIPRGSDDAGVRPWSLARWRRADRLAFWRARVATVVAGPVGAEIAAVLMTASILALGWPLLRSHAWMVSIVLAATAHVATWRYMHATAGEYSGDAAIHFQFARRFARGEWFCYNPGTFAAGSSSPLWTMGLGTIVRIAGEARLERLATGVAWASLHAALVLMAAAAVVAVGPNSLWGVAPAVLAGSTAVFVWTGRAMEAPFALLATAAVVLAFVSNHVIGVSIAVAVACLVRWEHAVTLAPFVAWACVTIGSPWPLLSYGPVALLAADVHRRTGSVLPASGRARRRYASLRAKALREDWRIWTARPDVWILAGAGLATGSAVGLVLGLWLAATAAFFALVVPGTYGGRYLVPALAAPALLATMGASRLLQIAPDAAMWPLSVLPLASFLPRWAATVWRDRPQVAVAAREAADLERGFRRRVAEDLARALPRDATIGLVEVDLLWLVGRDDIRVVGLDGVLDAAMVGALEVGALVPALRRRGATHVLVESCLYARAGWRGLDLAVLATADGPQRLVDGSLATPLAMWPYGNWGDRSSVWPWRLWRLDWSVAGTRS